MSEPSWLKYARQFDGVKEIPGPKSSPVIMGWIAKLAAKFGAWIKNTLPDDATPWCGTFVGYVMSENGFKIPANFMSARSWATWGIGCEPAVGAIMVFARSGGAHVAYYIAETKTHYKVFGANQSDAVNEMLIPKERCIAIRWPVTKERPTGKVLIRAGKTAVTNGNEK